MFSQTWHNLYPVEHKSLAINRLPVIRPLGLWQPAPIVICSDVSSAQALRSFDEQQLWSVIQCITVVCISHAVWKEELAKNSPYQPVSCSSTGSLSCTWWQNAPAHGSVPCHHQCALWRGRRDSTWRDPMSGWICEECTGQTQTDATWWCQSLS